MASFQEELRKMYHLVLVNSLAPDVANFVCGAGKVTDTYTVLLQDLKLLLNEYCVLTTGKWKPHTPPDVVEDLLEAMKYYRKYLQSNEASVIEQYAKYVKVKYIVSKWNRLDPVEQDAFCTNIHEKFHAI